MYYLIMHYCLSVHLCSVITFGICKVAPNVVKINLVKLKLHYFPLRCSKLEVAYNFSTQVKYKYIIIGLS